MMKLQEENITLKEKLKCLKDKTSYPETTNNVSLRETHMSWLFFTDRVVYKMKKPVKYPYFDFSTLEQRKRNCEEELICNRRFSPEVYKGLVPLTIDTYGNMALEGEGHVIEWFVKMEHLPDDLMMDVKIKNKDLKPQEMTRLGEVLSSFYLRPHAEWIQREFYIQRLRNFIITYLNEMKHPQFVLSEDRINKLIKSHLKFVSDHVKALEIRSEKIVDAHGDLRPEHVCLRDNPCLIDSLEFNKDLRMLDPLEELAFFSMECEMLDAGWAGDMVIDIYAQITEDYYNEDIIRFYKSIRAVFRALSSFRHILESRYSHEPKWRTKGEKYLALAEKYAQSLSN